MSADVYRRSLVPVDEDEVQGRQYEIIVMKFGSLLRALWCEPWFAAKPYSDASAKRFTRSL